MPRLKMSLGLIIRSKVNWVQNNNNWQTIRFISFIFDHITSIKFTGTINDVLKIHVVYNK